MLFLCMAAHIIQPSELQRLSAYRQLPTSLWRISGAGEQLVPDMAKEGVDMTEETEYMIERNAGKEVVSVESPSNAKEMRAVVLAGFGGLNKLRVIKKAMPEPQDGEVKIRVKAW